MSAPDQVRATLESMTPAERASVAWWATSLATHTTGKGLLPDGDWFGAMWRCGRGFGKTRIGSEHVNAISRYPELCAGRIAIVGKTGSDTRDTMILGESGILAVAEAYKQRVRYKPSRRLLEWPDSGTIATTYSDEAPGRLRGPQHGAAWADEIQEWENRETWDNLSFGLRLGPWPHLIGTLTPKATEIVKMLHADPSLVWTTGSMYENSRNLAPKFIEVIERRYAGTRIGRAEIDGDLLTDHGGALWTHALIEAGRRRRIDVPPLLRIAIAVDPCGSEIGEAEAESNSETGIVCAGIDGIGHVWILGDHSQPAEVSPTEWAKVVASVRRVERADRVFGELNYGGRMVEAVMRSVDPNLPFQSVWASEGKRTRAEPVAALYEQGRVHHVGMMAQLEDQLTTWRPGMKSPDRLDALVHVVTGLALGDDDEAGPLDGYLGARR